MKRRFLGKRNNSERYAVLGFLSASHLRGVHASFSYWLIFTEELMRSATSACGTKQTFALKFGFWPQLATC